MDGLRRITAATHTVRVGPRGWRLAPLTLADYGEIENRILAGRPDPLAAARGRLAGRPEEERRKGLDQIFSQLRSMRRVTLGDLDRWWQTPDGLSYRLWLMLRKAQPGVTLDAASELLRQANAAERAELLRRMADCHGWPDPWPSAPAAADKDEAVVPWRRWAVELSRAYGWTPAEIARLTVAQVCIYLGWEGSSASRQRMSVGQARDLCRRLLAERDAWIARMLEETKEATEVPGGDVPGNVLGADRLLTARRCRRPRRPHWAPPDADSPQAAMPSLPSAGLGRLRDLARDAATESHQVEQIRIARDQLAEQRKTNQHLERRRGSTAAVFEP